MTDYAALVMALYDELGRWQAVADACNNGTRHSAGYYQQIAKGRIRKPAAATAAGIEQATECPESLLKCDFSRVMYEMRDMQCPTVEIMPDDENRPKSRAGGNIVAIRAAVARAAAAMRGE